MADTPPPITGYKLPPLAWLRAFEAAARHSSFTAAAEELNLTQAAVSHQVRSLEKHLGVVLFERLPRSLRLTEIGSAYLPPLRRSFSELAAATTGLFGSTGRRSLTIRAPVSFVGLWLAQRLTNFQNRHPDIALRFASSVWTRSQSDEVADIDIRFGDGIWPGHSSELLIKTPSVVLCHPDLKPADPGRDGLAELVRRAPLIHVSDYEDLWQMLLVPLGIDLPQKGGISVDTNMGAVEMAAAGIGPVIAPQHLAEQSLASGRLVRCFDGFVPADQGHYILTADERRRASPETQLFRRWLLEEAATTMAQ
ncbi:LysR substrate-binding domain-containing protein [Rhizobiaceae bacterium n13]|uniref:LysR substrate-binding domain-containing protein n=1 Tax=Ferirhizobium litorale TaxID=2927786 RepID=A0AAE3QB33_9HYPH|nr:LysR substrate-binding domain-containing protein [Fererhizobium litorale]MDI7860415.1 LysR substrate-binding domain-containing protein [Fererhizobium litorale]MDI7920550.1 LysR substrate-binding domain-containing protein [Fererhizobium litorale]